MCGTCVVSQLTRCWCGHDASDHEVRCVACPCPILAIRGCPAVAEEFGPRPHLTYARRMLYDYTDD